MLKIGDFSRLAQVSIKALRYYDATGLLRPAAVDPFTGYRYYTLDQLPRLNRILMLKDLGLSLDQVAQMLNDDLPAHEMHRLLQIKRTELQQQIQHAQAQLTRLEKRLEQMRMEGKMPDYQVTTKRIEPQRVLSIRQFVPDGADIGHLLAEVRQTVQNHHIKQTGPWIVLYHHAGYRDHDLDVEFAVPVDSDTPYTVVIHQSQKMSVRTIPLIETAVVALLQGGYDNIKNVYMALSTYIHEHGHNYLGPAREVYLRGPDATSSPAEYLTEIQYPIGELTAGTIVDGIELPSRWNAGDQYLRLSRRARAALEAATREAVSLEQLEVSPVHILLGLLRDSKSLAKHVLDDFGVTHQQVRTLVSHGSSPSSDPIVTDDARQIVSYADTEARKLGHDYIGTEHLLLSLAQRLEDSEPSLNAIGVDAEQIRAAVLQSIKR